MIPTNNINNPFGQNRFMKLLKITDSCISVNIDRESQVIIVAMSPNEAPKEDETIQAWSELFL